MANMDEGVDVAFVEPANQQKPGLRLWPAWVIAIGQAVALVLTVTPSIQNLTRFIFIMAGPLVCGALFSMWLLLGSRLRLKEKIWIAIAGLLSSFVAVLISDSDDALRTAMWIYGVPLAIFAVTAALTIWAAAFRRRSASFGLWCSCRRTGLCGLRSGRCRRDEPGFPERVAQLINRLVVRQGREAGAREVCAADGRRCSATEQFDGRGARP